MATGIGSFTDALAFGALNDVLSLFHDKTHTEDQTNMRFKFYQPGGKLAGHDFRAISLKAETVLMPAELSMFNQNRPDQLYAQ